MNMIKNASRNGKETVVVPFSNIKLRIAECLVSNGYLKSANKKSQKGFPVLEVVLAYNDNGQPKVKEVKRISKLSCRVYKGVKDIKTGYGLAVISTPKGILTDKQARREMVGGEVLFKIW